jgi:hypothetical protein
MTCFNVNLRYAAPLRRERLAAVERDQERLERERTETETVITEEKRSRTSIRQALHTHVSYTVKKGYTWMSLTKLPLAGNF